MNSRYSAAALVRFGIGGGLEAVHSKHSGQWRPLPSRDADLLAFCQGYRTLEEHALLWLRETDLAAATRLASRGPAWLSRFVRRSARTYKVDSHKLDKACEKLAVWARDGFLVSEADLPRECRNAGPGSPPASIGAIGFTTRNRTALLRRALESYAGNVERHAREAELLVIDDSANSTSESATRSMLGDLRHKVRAPVRFAGAAERRGYSQRLCQASGVEPEIVDFALLGDPRCPVTTGAARNSLLLDCAGEAYILADDDGVCQIAPCPEIEAGVALSSRPEPTQFWFYPDRETTLASVQFADLSLLSLHEELLGCDVAAKIGGLEKPGELSLDALGPEFDLRLRRRGGRIRAVMAGIVGDSGIGSTGYLFGDPFSRRRLLQSEEFYRTVTESRQVFRSPTRFTIGDAPLCMAGNLSIDNRTLLPPFVPVQRNSDGMFARLLRRGFPESCLGYLPYSVLHDPAERRRQRLEDWWEDLRRVRFADIVDALLTEGPGRDEDRRSNAASRLKQLGERLAEIGQASPAEFENRIRTKILERNARRLARDRRNESAGLPEFYVKLRQRQLEIERESILKPGYLVPRDLLAAHAGGEAEVRLLTQQLIVKLGRLLQSWEAIWKGALELRQGGRRLTV